MFGLINRIKGFTELSVSGADTEKFLNECARNGVPVLRAKRCGSYEIIIALPHGCVPAAERIAAGNCSCLEIKRVVGATCWRRRLRRRILPVTVGIAVILLLFWSRFYVWRIELSGNESVSSGEILNVLSDCGVECGAFWPAFSSDKIRTEILYSIPELSWAQVNMRGSVAEVSVTERGSPPEMPYKTEECDIVASHEGFIRNITALEGEKSCLPGAAVSEGDVIISGIIASEFSEPDFVRAMGSVIAEVNSSETAVMPSEIHRKADAGKIKTKYALILGNNRINFYSDSSISGVLCDKIISKWDLELGDIFALPISVVIEREYFYSLTKTECDGFNSAEALEISLRRNIPGNAEILNEKLLYDDLGGLYTATMKCRWLGEIGKVSPISEERMEEALWEYSIKADDKNG